MGEETALGATYETETIKGSTFFIQHLGQDSHTAKALRAPYWPPETAALRSARLSEIPWRSSG